MEKTKKVEQEKKGLTLEERRLRELRKEILGKVEDKLLDEYTLIYISLILRYAGSLQVNFNNLEESK